MSARVFPTVSSESMQRYRKRRLDDIQKMSRAMEARDFKTLRDVGHRIKGNAALYGLDDLGAIAQALEEAAEAGDLGKATSCLARFESEVNRITV